MAKGLIQPATWRSTTLIALESAVIFGALASAAYLELGVAVVPQGFLAQAVLFTFVCQVCLYYGDLYDDPHAGGNRAELVVRTMQALGATLLLLALVYTIFPRLIIPRGVLMPAAMLVVLAVVLWRLAFAWLARQVSHERLLLVGASASGLALTRELLSRQELGVHIVGVVDVSEPPPATLSPLDLLGGIEDIPAIVRARSVDRVVVSLADARGKLPMQKLLEMKLDGVRFDHLPSVYEEYTGKIAVENLRPSWLIFSPGFRKRAGLLAAKRLFDVAAASLGLLLSAPIVFVLGALVKITSPGPALYAQQRVGLRGKVFTVYKMRSMRADAERHTGPVWSPRAGDTRTTRLGRWMRRTRLDELPQLWNILRGDMSLVGPRPERPEFVTSLMQQIPFYGQRHIVKPGLTGWAQVRYTYGASVEDATEKLQYDLFYIKNLSLSLDVFIVLETIKTVLLRRGH
jgi:sugar transferase (PEP-CTERM system associated)